MKKLIIILICSFSINTYSQEITTYYLIRHAEKDRKDISDSNPALTAQGQKRAERWSEIFKHINFDAVYSTDYRRTISTAKPTADARQLEIQFYNPRTLYSEDFKKETLGKTILVVGHSNTTPEFVNAIIGENRYEQINDNNNANIYIVTVMNGIATSTLLSL